MEDRKEGDPHASAAGYTLTRVQVALGYLLPSRHLWDLPLTKME